MQDTAFRGRLAGGIIRRTFDGGSEISSAAITEYKPRTATEGQRILEGGSQEFMKYS